MTDTTTRQQLTVETNGGAGPYIVLPLAQLDTVKAQLDANQVRYWVDEEVLSLDGKPEVAFVNLGAGTNPELVQRLLDCIP